MQSVERKRARRAVYIKHNRMELILGKKSSDLARAFQKYMHCLPLSRYKTCTSAYEAAESLRYPTLGVVNWCGRRGMCKVKIDCVPGYERA